MVDETAKPKISKSEPNKQVEVQLIEGIPFNWRLTSRSHTWKPSTDVYESEEDLIVRVEVAGMKEQDFSIELNGRVLSIHGVRQDISERRAYHQMEIRFGEFHIELVLPIPIEPDRVQAVYGDGFLRVTLPKSTPRQIPISS
jgi:HSP20 family protein